VINIILEIKYMGCYRAYKGVDREMIHLPYLIPVGSPYDFCPEEGCYSKVVRGLSCPE
jgi:hypothetical protein